MLRNYHYTKLAKQYRVIPFEDASIEPYGALANSTIPGQYPIHQKVKIGTPPAWRVFIWPSAEHAIIAQKLIYMLENLASLPEKQARQEALIKELEYIEISPQVNVADIEKKFLLAQQEALQKANRFEAYFQRNVLEWKLEQHPRLKQLVVDCAAEGVLPLALGEADAASNKQLSIMILELGNQFLEQMGGRPAIPNPAEYYDECKESVKDAEYNDLRKKLNPSKKNGWHGFSCRDHKVSEEQHFDISYDRNQQLIVKRSAKANYELHISTAGEQQVVHRSVLTRKEWEVVPEAPSSIESKNADALKKDYDAYNTITMPSGFYLDLAKRLWDGETLDDITTEDLEKFFVWAEIDAEDMRQEDMRQIGTEEKNFYAWMTQNPRQPTTLEAISVSIKNYRNPIVAEAQAAAIEALAPVGDDFTEYRQKARQGKKIVIFNGNAVADQASNAVINPAVMVPYLKYLNKNHVFFLDANNNQQPELRQRLEDPAFQLSNQVFLEAFDRRNFTEQLTEQGFNANQLFQGTVSAGKKNQPITIKMAEFEITLMPEAFFDVHVKNGESIFSGKNTTILKRLSDLECKPNRAMLETMRRNFRGFVSLTAPKHFYELEQEQCVFCDADSSSVLAAQRMGFVSIQADPQSANAYLPKLFDQIPQTELLKDEELRNAKKRFIVKPAEKTTLGYSEEREKKFAEVADSAFSTLEMLFLLNKGNPFAGDESLSILKRGTSLLARDNIVKVAHISINQIVDYILAKQDKQPLEAARVFNAFFQIRGFTLGRWLERNFARRNFRAEIAAQPEVLNKLLKDANPTLRQVIDESKLLQTSHIEKSFEQLLKKLKKAKAAALVGFDNKSDIEKYDILRRTMGLLSEEQKDLKELPQLFLMRKLNKLRRIVVDSPTVKQLKIDMDAFDKAESDLEQYLCLVRLFANTPVLAQISDLLDLPNWFLPDWNQEFPFKEPTTKGDFAAYYQYIENKLRIDKRLTQSEVLTQEYKAQLAELLTREIPEKLKTEYDLAAFYKYIELSLEANIPPAPGVEAAECSDADFLTLLRLLKSSPPITIQETNAQMLFEFCKKLNLTGLQWAELLAVAENNIASKLSIYICRQVDVTDRNSEIIPERKAILDKIVGIEDKKIFTDKLFEISGQNNNSAVISYALKNAHFSSSKEAIAAAIYLEHIQLYYSNFPTTTRVGKIFINPVANCVEIIGEIRQTHQQTFQNIFDYLTKIGVENFDLNNPQQCVAKLDRAIKETYGEGDNNVEWFLRKLTKYLKNSMGDALPHNPLKMYVKTRVWSYKQLFDLKNVLTMLSAQPAYSANYESDIYELRLRYSNYALLFEGNEAPTNQKYLRLFVKDGKIYCQDNNNQKEITIDDIDPPNAYPRILMALGPHGKIDQLSPAEKVMLFKVASKKLNLQLQLIEANEVIPAMDQHLEAIATEIKKTKTEELRAGDKVLDLREYPIAVEKMKPDQCLPIGDLHGNALKLVYILQHNGVINIEEQDYKKLVEIYYTPNAFLTKDQINTFDEIIGRMSVINKTSLITLIGDILADRSGNDYFVLMVLTKLKQSRANVETLLSNHDVTAIQHLERLGEPIALNDFMGNWQDHSFLNLNTVIRAGLVERTKVIKMFEEVYTPQLKLISYEFEENNFDNQVVRCVRILKNLRLNPPFKDNDLIKNALVELGVLNVDMNKPEELVGKLKVFLEQKYQGKNNKVELFMKALTNSLKNKTSIPSELNPLKIYQKHDKVIVISTHARGDLPNIEAIAKLLGVKYKGKNADEIAKTIDRINEKFNTAHRDVRASLVKFCKDFELARDKKNKKGNAIYELIWNRKNDDLQILPEWVKWRNGHQTTKSDLDSTCLDNDFGKFYRFAKKSEAGFAVTSNLPFEVANLDKARVEDMHHVVNHILSRETSNDKLKVFNKLFGYHWFYTSTVRKNLLKRPELLLKLYIDGDSEMRKAINKAKFFSDSHFSDSHLNTIMARLIDPKAKTDPNLIYEWLMKADNVLFNRIIVHPQFETLKTRTIDDAWFLPQLLVVENPVKIASILNTLTNELQNKPVLVCDLLEKNNQSLFDAVFLKIGGIRKFNEAAFAEELNKRPALICKLLEIDNEQVFAIVTEKINLAEKSRAPAFQRELIKRPALIRKLQGKDLGEAAMLELGQLVPQAKDEVRELLSDTEEERPPENIYGGESAEFMPRTESLKDLLEDSAGSSKDSFEDSVEEPPISSTQPEEKREIPVLQPMDKDEARVSSLSDILADPAFINALKKTPMLICKLYIDDPLFNQLAKKLDLSDQEFIRQLTLDENAAVLVKLIENLDDNQAIQVINAVALRNDHLVHLLANVLKTRAELLYRLLEQGDRALFNVVMEQKELADNFSMHYFNRLNDQQFVNALKANPKLLCDLLENGDRSLFLRVIEVMRGQAESESFFAEMLKDERLREELKIRPNLVEKLVAERNGALFKKLFKIVDLQVIATVFSQAFQADPNRLWQLLKITDQNTYDIDLFASLSKNEIFFNLLQQEQRQTHLDGLFAAARAKNLIRENRELITALLTICEGNNFVAFQDLFNFSIEFYCSLLEEGDEHLLNNAIKIGLIDLDDPEFVKELQKRPKLICMLLERDDQDFFNQVIKTVDQETLNHVILASENKGDICLRIIKTIHADFYETQNFGLKAKIVVAAFWKDQKFGKELQSNPKLICDLLSENWETWSPKRFEELMRLIANNGEIENFFEIMLPNEAFQKELNRRPDLLNKFFKLLTANNAELFKKLFAVVDPQLIANLFFPALESRPWMLWELLGITSEESSQKSYDVKLFLVLINNEVFLNLLKTASQKLVTDLPKIFMAAINEKDKADAIFKKFNGELNAPELISSLLTICDEESFASLRTYYNFSEKNIHTFLEEGDPALLSNLINTLKLINLDDPDFANALNSNPKLMCNLLEAAQFFDQVMQKINLNEKINDREFAAELKQHPKLIVKLLAIEGMALFTPIMQHQEFILAVKKRGVIEPLSINSLVQLAVANLEKAEIIIRNFADLLRDRPDLLVELMTAANPELFNLVIKYIGFTDDLKYDDYRTRLEAAPAEPQSRKQAIANYLVQQAIEPKSPNPSPANKEKELPKYKELKSHTRLAFEKVGADLIPSEALKVFLRIGGDKTALEIYEALQTLSPEDAKRCYEHEPFRIELNRMLADGQQKINEENPKTRSPYSRFTANSEKVTLGISTRNMDAAVEEAIRDGFTPVKGIDNNEFNLEHYYSLMPGYPTENEIKEAQKQNPKAPDGTALTLGGAKFVDDSFLLAPAYNLKSFTGDRQLFGSSAVFFSHSKDVDSKIIEAYVKLFEAAFDAYGKNVKPEDRTMRPLILPAWGTGDFAGHTDSHIKHNIKLIAQAFCAAMSSKADDLKGVFIELPLSENPTAREIFKKAVEKELNLPEFIIKTEEIKAPTVGAGLK